MINPLQYYVIRRRPLGIWIGATLLAVEFIMQLINIFAAHRLPPHLLIVALPLFAAALMGLIMRRVVGMWLAGAFFVANAYLPLMVIPHLPLRDWWCALVWWGISGLGIVALFFNRRCFDERLVHIDY